MLIITQDTSFELQANESLLEALERTGHEVEYQCRSGYCGMCRIKLLAGSVHYPQAPLAFVANDDILPCCCEVTSPIKIDCHKILTVDRIQNDLFAPDLLDGLTQDTQIHPSPNTHPASSIDAEATTNPHAPIDAP